MNEIIVWDKDNKYFLIDFESCKFTIKDIKNSKDLGNMARYSFLPHIGKKDINNKKIYADCSIVEFDYLDKKLKGYFKFDNETLRYFIVLSSGGVLLYEVGLVLNLKIIDTIQEREARNANSK